MRLVTRNDLGWPSSAAPKLSETPRGVKVHYEGTPVPKVDHSKCASRWTSIRNSHLANTAENYSDVAYSYAVCQHGYVFEGRRHDRQTGANGNQELNRRHYAVLVMVGSSGDTQPSAAAVAALREVILYLRNHGAGNEIKGHRDGFATSCPGGPLYNLVTSGKLEPNSNPVEEDVALTAAEVDQIVNGVWAHTEEGPTGDGRQVRTGAVLGWLDHTTILQNVKIDTLTELVNALLQKVEAIQTTNLTDGQINAIAAEVLNGLHGRLES